MKKILLSIISMTIGVSAFSQILNADFENWTAKSATVAFPPQTINYDSLHNWQTINDFVGFAAANGFAIQPGATKEPGNVNSFALGLETIDCQPCALAGLPSTIPAFAFFNGDYTQRPESVSFDYKFAPVNGDWGAAAFLLTSGTGSAMDTIAGAIIPFENAQANWTNMTVPLSYFSGANPDSIRVSLLSSGDTLLNALYPNSPNAQVGTQIFFDDIQLNMPTPGVASPVGNIIATDVANNNNGLDLNVEFAAGMDETTIGEYRIMAVKEANAGSFDLTAAQAVGAGNYFAQSPMGIQIYSGTYTAVSTDVDGDAIQNNVPYRIFILSVADGTVATTDNLSPMSNSITLMPAMAVPPATVIGADVSDNGDGTDLDIYFSQSTDEATVGEYRVMIVKSGNAGSFDLAAAQAVGSGDYVSVSPSGSDYQSTQMATTTDVDGDVIVENQPYTIFVLAIADGTVAGTDALSNPSQSVTLQNTSSINENEQSVSIYPNPARNNVNIQTTLTDYQLTVTTVDGKVVLNQNMNSNTSINVNNWSEGVYVFTLKNENHTITKKIMIK